MRSIEVPGMRNPETTLPDLDINRTFAARFRAHQPTVPQFTKAIEEEINAAKTAGFVKSASGVQKIRQEYAAILYRHNAAESSVTRILTRRSALLQTQRDAQKNKFIDLVGIKEALQACEKELNEVTRIILETAEKLPDALIVEHSSDSADTIRSG